MHHEAFQFSNVATDQAFVLVEGGRYLVTVVGSGFGTVSIQALGADGTTWLDLKAAFDKPNGVGGTEEDLVIGGFSANGAKTLDLAPGTYRLSINAATGVTAAIARAPMG